MTDSAREHPTQTERERALEEAAQLADQSAETDRQLLRDKAVDAGHATMAILTASNIATAIRALAAPSTAPAPASLDDVARELPTEHQDPSKWVSANDTRRADEAALRRATGTVTDAEVEAVAQLYCKTRNGPHSWARESEAQLRYYRSLARNLLTAAAQARVG